MSTSEENLVRAVKILRGVWSTYRVRSSNDVNKLHLMYSFFHSPTALHNEGIWHNCVMGMNYFILGRRLEDMMGCEWSGRSLLERLGASLLHLNFDSQRYLFRSRIESGHWDRNSTTWKHFTTYDEGHKLMHQVIALLFYSFFLEQGSTSAIVELPGAPKLDLLQLQESIQQHFYNAEQGLYRRELLDEAEQKHRGEYFRAVDHALLLLLQKRLSRLHLPMNEQLRQVNLEQQIIEKFGYSDLENSKSYIRVGGTAAEEKREAQQFMPAHFSWQDIWVALALMGNKDFKVDEFLNAYMRAYQWQGSEEKPFKMICNEPVRHGKTSWGAPMQRFTDDNALAYMALRWLKESQGSMPIELGDHVREFENQFEPWLQRFILNKGIVPPGAIILDKIEEDVDNGKYVNSKEEKLYCVESDSPHFNGNTLWPASELLFSMLMNREDLLGPEPTKESTKN